MADDRPMAEQLQAPTGGFESAIVVPIINAQNFELKSSLINLVIFSSKNRIFRGGNDEEPHAHIRHFESITNNQRYPDVPNTTIKLLLFPFSLDGVAKTWLDKEPPNSILTWDDLVSKNELNEMKNMMKALVPNPAPIKAVEERLNLIVVRILLDKEEVKGISDPAARRKACFLDKFRIINQGRVIHSPKVASISAISHIFPNNNLEDSFKMGDDDLNFIPNKELDKEDLIPIPRESKIGKDCDFTLLCMISKVSRLSRPPFFKPFSLRKDDFPSRNDEATLNGGVNSEPSIESLLNDDDDDLFEIDSNNDEWKRILYGEDFERMNVDSDKTKDFDKSSSNVFKSLSDELEPGSSSYVEGNDLDFHISDILFSTINEDKIFNPGIFDNVLPRKSSLTLDVFDPLHPPLMDFHVFRILEDSWFKIVERQSNSYNFHR
ncbi:hypothetical protein Tco_0555931 [Tanacetum coccineum]